MGRNSRGFTLVEIMLVVAILAAIMGIAVPKLKKSNSNIKSFMRELSVLSIEVRHYARLKNATYRIVFNLKGKEDSYFVEASNHAVMVKSAAHQKLEDEMNKEDKPSSPFSKVDKPLKQERFLPSNLFIKSVETKSHAEPITKGTAYIYFSPEGLVDQSVVQLTDGKDLTWSLVFNPLTGHADMISKPVTLQELEIK